MASWVTAGASLPRRCPFLRRFALPIGPRGVCTRIVLLSLTPSTAAVHHHRAHRAHRRCRCADQHQHQHLQTAAEGVGSRPSTALTSPNSSTSRRPPPQAHGSPPAALTPAQYAFSVVTTTAEVRVDGMDAKQRQVSQPHRGRQWH